MSASSSEGSEYVPYCCSCYHCYRRDRFSYTATKRIDENVPLRAVKENDVEALQKWLDEHPRVKLSNWGNSVLSEAVHRNRVKCVKALLRHGGVDVNEWFYKESDPSWWCNGVSDSQLVHKAARLKNERILKMLINHGAFLDASTIHRPELNLYYIAASNRNEKVMELIIDADVCDISNDRRRLYDYDSASFNPLWCAMKKKNKAVVDLLVEAGASVEKDVLCDAVAHDDNPKWLRRLHAIDDARFLEFSGEMCRTAVWNNNLVNLDFLLEKGANFDEPDDDGSSACAIAARSGNSAIVERLLRAGAKVPSCALARNSRTFDLLVAAGADMVADFQSHCVANNNQAHRVTDFLEKALASRKNRASLLRPFLREMPFLCSQVMAVAFARHEALVVRLLASMGIPMRRHKLPFGCFYCKQPDFLIELFAIGVELHVCDDHSHLADRTQRADRTQLVHVVLDHAIFKVNALTAFAVGIDLTTGFSFTTSEITQRQFELMRLRGLEICIGLQSLRLNALQLCEIVVFMFAPLESWVPFHKVWAIATTVKHWRSSNS